MDPSTVTAQTSPHLPQILPGVKPDRPLWQGWEEVRGHIHPASLRCPLADKGEVGDLYDNISNFKGLTCCHPYSGLSLEPNDLWTLIFPETH